MRPAPAFPRLILVGPIPPPVNGQSVSFELLVRHVEQLGLPATIINISEAAPDRAVGTYSWRRARELARILARYVMKSAGRNRVIYLTIAQSWPGFLRDLVVIWWAALWQHRIVLHLHGGGFGAFVHNLPRWKSRLVLATWRKADRAIVPSASLRTMLAADETLYARTVAISNTVPHLLADLPSTGKELPADRAPRVLYLGNLVRTKGYSIVLEAVGLLHERGAPVDAAFCGDFIVEDESRAYDAGADESRREFEAFVSRHGLGEHVHWYGTVSGTEKDEVLRASEFFVLPTAYRFEGQPVSILEAMAYGVVVVTTRFDGIVDTVLDGVTGRLTNRDAESVAEAIAGYIADPGSYTAASAAARRRFHNHHSQAQHLDAVLACILPERP